ncbi:MAG: DUF2341 domain-containing protein [Candidatus Methanogasteraceae archaeon]
MTKPTTHFHSSLTVLLLTLALLITFTTPVSADLPGWSYRMPVTITGAGSEVSDYPVLVDVDTAGMVAAGKIASDCGDIRFTAADGSTLLSYWVESGANTDSTKIWVKVQLIPGSGTTIYLYYGNPDASSQSNKQDTFNRAADALKASYCLDENSGQTAGDTSGNGNDGNIHDAAWTAGGRFNSALGFDGASDYVNCGNDYSLQINDEITLDAWVKSSSSAEQSVIGKGTVKLGLGGLGQNMSNVEWPAFGAGYKRAQTFKPDADSTVSTARVNIKKAASYITGDVTVAICTDGGAQPGTEIGTYTISDSSIGESFAWHDASFDCALVGGTTYWLVLESPAASGGWDYYWTAGYPTDYSDGEACYYDSSAASWTTDGLGSIDMTFELQTTAADRISMPDSDTFKFSAYYGWLNVSSVNWAESGLELIIVHDDNPAEIQNVRGFGVDVYYYISLGSTYRDSPDKDAWEQDVTDSIDAHCSYVDGFFWDEVDPGYYGDNCKSDFDERLTRINNYVHSNGKKTIANGVRYYAVHCGSDYYLWESFMSTFTPGPIYGYVDFFNRPADNNPYNWTNNIAKWEYLRDNDVLGKTLAHSYGDPSDDDMSIYDYIAARVLGLKGYGYMDSNNFASSEFILADGVKWNLGTRMSYTVDESGETLSGRFTNGVVEDDIGETTYTTDLISSPLAADSLGGSLGVAGLSLSLVRGQVDFLSGTLRSSTTLTDGSFHHVAVTLNRAECVAEMYVDGALSSERTLPDIPFNFAESDLIIGDGFSGTIDEIKIYDSTLGYSDPEPESSVGSEQDMSSSSQSNEGAAASTGTFTLESAAPVVSSIVLCSADDESTPVSSMDPTVEYAVVVGVCDSNTLDDLTQLNVVIRTSGTTGDDSVTDMATYRWTASGEWTQVGPAGSWGINTGACSTPATFSGTSGTWVLHFSPGVVARAGTGIWEVYVTATDGAQQTGSNTENGKNMNWRGEIESTDTSYSFGGIDMGEEKQVSTSSPTGDADVDVGVIVNGNYKLQSKSSATWCSTEYVATLNTSYPYPLQAGEFALKNSAVNNLGDCSFVESEFGDTYIQGFYNREGPTPTEDGVCHSIYQWVSVAESGLLPGTYNGTYVVQIANV